MENYITTGIVGAATAAISTIVTWLTTRRQYMADIRKRNFESDGDNIENYNKMLAFYQKLCDDSNERLEALLRKYNELLAECERLRSEQEVLKRQIDALQNSKNK